MNTFFSSSQVLLHASRAVQRLCINASSLIYKALFRYFFGSVNLSLLITLAFFKEPPSISLILIQHEQYIVRVAKAGGGTTATTAVAYE